jgi:thiamine-phosphate pyrophosphorylase
VRHLPWPPVLVITDRRQAEPRALEWVIAGVLEGGIRWISLREKDLDPAERLALLRRIQPLVSSAGALLMVHDDLDAAVRLGLDGVHLPDGGDAGLARALLPDALIGQSWHGEAGSAKLNDPVLDYLTLSPIFLTDSKPGYGPALGPEAIARATALTAKPLIGLGGITRDRIALCRDAGASGVAVMGEIMRASDPATLCAGLVACFGPAPPEG